MTANDDTDHLHTNMSSDHSTDREPTTDASNTTDAQTRIDARRTDPSDPFQDRSSKRGRHGSVKRRRIIQLCAGATTVGLAGCLGGNGDDDRAETDDDANGADDGAVDVDDADDESDVPRRSDELQTAIDTLEAPEPGMGVLVHDDGREFELELHNWIPGEDPEDACFSGQNEYVRAVGEYHGERYEDGGYLRVFLQIGDHDDGTIYTNLFLYVEEEPGGDTLQMGRQAHSVPPADGEPGENAGAVEVVDGTWYAGARMSDFSDVEEPEALWIAITCE